jgi:hypothetical protein
MKANKPSAILYYSQLIHRYSHAIHGSFNKKIPTSAQTLYCIEFQDKKEWGKIKNEKIWWLSGKKCYFVSIN